MDLGTAETRFGTRLNAEETKMKDRIIMSAQAPDVVPNPRGLWCVTALET
jgi:hypothetical protein